MSTAQQPKVHRFNLTQYYEVGELGLLDKRTELLEGIITDMEPIGPWHANVGDILARIFNAQSCDRFRVRVQYPINLGEASQPRPDLVLYPPGVWRMQHPVARDQSNTRFQIQWSHVALLFDLRRAEIWPKQFSCWLS